MGSSARTPRPGYHRDASIEEEAVSTYEVVSPLGRRAGQRKRLVQRPRTLDGVTIGELSNNKFDTDFTFAVIEKALLERYPKVKFVRHTAFGDTYGASETQVIESLPQKLAQLECDVVISGNAG
jgi:hypothetical protein